MQGAKLVVLSTLCWLSWVAPSAANLIQNGGFEDTAVKSKSWAWFYADDVEGWSGSNIEIWDNYGGVTAYEGAQHAELNAHAGNGQSFSIYQSFATQIGMWYDLSFAYSARASSNEAFLVSLLASDDSEFFSTLLNDHEVKQWSLFNNSFQAVDAVTTLRFTSVTPYAGTVGNFLDDIQVNTSFKSLNVLNFASVVSAPSAALLALLGVVVMLRRKVNKG
jgi:hypothetical protein